MLVFAQSFYDETHIKTMEVEWVCDDSGAKVSFPSPPPCLCQPYDFDANV